MKDWQDLDLAIFLRVKWQDLGQDPRSCHFFCVKMARSRARSMFKLYEDIFNYVLCVDFLVYKSSFSSFVAHVGEKKLVMFVAFFCPPGGGASLSSIRVEKVCRHLLAAAGQVVADGCFGPTRSQPASLF